MRFLVATGLAVAALGAGIVLAQGPPPPPPPPPPAPAGFQIGQQATGTGLILGRVVDAAGGGVSGAIVMLVGGAVQITQSVTPSGDARQTMTFSTTVTSSSSGSGPTSGQVQVMPMGPRRVLTDGQGQFAFHDLPKGNFTFTVTSPGYTGGGFGQKIPGGPTRPFELADGEKVGDVVLRVWKMASISGMLVDEAGEPAVGMTVRAMRQSIVGGKRKLVSSQTTTTDDRGMYRLGSLMPGEYVVVVPNTVTTMPAGMAGGGRQVMLNGQPAMIAMDVEAANFTVTLPAGNPVQVGDVMMSTGSTLGNVTVGPPPSEDGRVAAYVTTFYPASGSAAQAASITVGSGEERSNVDLQLRLMPTARITGTVSGPEGPAANMQLRLLPSGVEEMATDAGLETATAMSDGLGRFTFLGVPQGAYTIKALKTPRGGGAGPVAVMRSSDGSTMTVNVSQTVVAGVAGGRGGAPIAATSEPTYFAEVPISISGDDVNGLAVMLREGLKASGRIVFEGNAARPTPDMIQRIAVTLQSSDARMGIPPMSSKTNPDGSFTTAAYPPGRYFVSAGSPQGPWRLKSVMVNGRDVSMVSLDLSTGDVDGLVLTFMDASTSLSGNVMGLPEARDAYAMVFAFPANYRQWAEEGMGSRGTRSATISKTGAYSLSELPPGDYLIVAINADQVPEARDLHFYEALSRSATLVTLGAGEKKTTDLKVVQIR